MCKTRLYSASLPVVCWGAQGCEMMRVLFGLLLVMTMLTGCVPTARATVPAKTGAEIVGIYDHWETLTQLQRTDFEQGIVGRPISERCAIDDVRRDGRVDLDCGQRGLKTVMLYGVPADQAKTLTKGQQYAFTATVRSLKVTLTNDLTLDWVSSP